MRTECTRVENVPFFGAILIKPWHSPLQGFSSVVFLYEFYELFETYLHQASSPARGACFLRLGACDARPLVFSELIELSSQVPPTDFFMDEFTKVGSDKKPRNVVKAYEAVQDLKKQAARAREANIVGKVSLSDDTWLDLHRLCLFLSVLVRMPCV